MNSSIDNNRLSLQSTLQRLIAEGKTIRQISRTFDQEVASARVELYNNGVSEQQIQSRLTDLNRVIDEILAATFSRPPNPPAQHFSGSVGFFPMPPPPRQAGNPIMQPMGINLPQVLVSSNSGETRQRTEHRVDAAVRDLTRKTAFVTRTYPEDNWNDLQKLDYIVGEIEELDDQLDSDEIYAGAYMRQAALRFMLELDPTFYQRNGSQILDDAVLASHKLKYVTGRISAQLPVPVGFFHNVPGCM